MDSFGKRLRAAMRDAGIKNAQLARKLNVTPAAVSQWLSDTAIPRRDNAVTLAAALNVPVERLLGSTLSDVESFPLRTHPAPSVKERTLPVYGSVEAGGGAMLIQQEPIDYTYRSETSMGADCFACHVLGDSMEPAFERGEQVIVDPRRVAMPGDACVFVDESDPTEWRAVVKRLIRVTDRAWVVRQFNPAREYELPRDKWPRALKIVEKRFR